MKKIKLFGCVLFALVLLMQFQSAYAISGACSDHGGVDCSAGASTNGNAICNDGWESSTLYSETDECTNIDVCSPDYSTATINTYSTQDSAHRAIIQANIALLLATYEKNLASIIATVNSDIATQQAEDQSVISQITSNEQAQVEITKANAFENDPYAGAGSPLTNAISSIEGLYGNEINGDNTQMTSDINAIKAQGDSLTALAQACVDSLTNIKNTIGSLENSCNVKYGGATAGDNINSCSCPAGYVMKNNWCTSSESICQAQYGNTSYADSNDGSCHCSGAFGYDPKTKQCTQMGGNMPIPTITASNDTVQSTATAETTPVPTVISQPVITPQSMPIKITPKIIVQKNMPTSTLVDLLSNTGSLTIATSTATTAPSQNKPSFLSTILHYLNPFNWFIK